MVSALCGDISECLDRLELGSLVGYLLIPDRGAWAMSSFGGTTHGGAGKQSPGKQQSGCSF